MNNFLNLSMSCLSIMTGFCYANEASIDNYSITEIRKNVCNGDLLATEVSNFWLEDLLSMTNIMLLRA